MRFEFKDVVLRWRTLGRLKCSAPGPWQPPALMLRVDSVRAVNADRRWLAAPLSSIVEESRGQAVVTVRKLWAFECVEALMCPPEAQALPIGRAVHAATPLLAPTSLELRMTLRKTRLGLASRGFAMEFSTPRLAFCALERAVLRAATPCLVAVYFALCRTLETEGMATPQWAAGKGGAEEGAAGHSRGGSDRGRCEESTEESDGDDADRAISPDGRRARTPSASPPVPGATPAGADAADEAAIAQLPGEGEPAPATKPRRTSLFARLLRRKRRPSAQQDPQAAVPGSGEDGEGKEGPVLEHADGASPERGGALAGGRGGDDGKDSTADAEAVEVAGPATETEAAEVLVPGMGTGLGLDHPDFVITLATDLVTVALPTEGAGPSGSGLAVLSAETLLIDYLWPSHLPAYETVTQIRVRRVGAHFATGAAPPRAAIQRPPPTSAPLVELMSTEDEGEGAGERSATAQRVGFPARFDAPDWVQTAGTAPHGPEGGSDAHDGDGSGASSARAGHDGRWHLRYFSLARFQPPQRVPEQEVEVRVLPTRVHAAPAAWRAVSVAVARDWRPEWVSGLWDGVTLVDSQAASNVVRPRPSLGAGKGGGEEDEVAAEAGDEVHEEEQEEAAAAVGGAAGASGAGAEGVEGEGEEQQRGQATGAVQLLAEYNGTWILRLLADAVAVAVPPSAGSPPYELRVADAWVERLPWEREAQLSGDARAKFPLWWLPPAREGAHAAVPPLPPRGRPGVAVSAIHGAVWSVGVPSLDLVCAGGDRRLLSAAGRAVVAVDEWGSPTHVSADLRRAAVIASPAVLDSAAAAAAAHLRTWRRAVPARARGGSGGGGGDKAEQRPVWRVVGWDVALGRVSLALSQRAADPTPDLEDRAALVLRASDVAAGIHHTPRPRRRQTTRRRGRRTRQRSPALGMQRSDGGQAERPTATAAPTAPKGDNAGLGVSRAVFAAGVHVGSWEVAVALAQGGKERVIAAVIPAVGPLSARTAWASVVHAGPLCGSVPPTLAATALGRRLGGALAVEATEPATQRRRSSSACSEEGEGDRGGVIGGGAAEGVDHFAPVHPSAWQGLPPAAAAQRVDVDLTGEVVADAVSALRQVSDAVSRAAALVGAAQSENSAPEAGRAGGRGSTGGRPWLGITDPLLAGCALTVHEVALRLPHPQGAGGGDAAPDPSLRVGLHRLSCTLRCAHQVGPGLDAFLQPVSTSRQHSASGGAQILAAGGEQAGGGRGMVPALRSGGKGRREAPHAGPNLWLRWRVHAELRAALALPGSDGLVVLAAHPGVEQTLEGVAAEVAAAVSALQWRGEHVSAVTRKPHWAAALWEAILAARHLGVDTSAGGWGRRVGGDWRCESRFEQGPIVTLERGLRTAAARSAVADVTESLRTVAESAGDAWASVGSGIETEGSDSPRAVPPAPKQAEEIVHDAVVASTAASACTEAASVPMLRSAVAAATRSEGCLLRVETLAQDLEAAVRHTEDAAARHAVEARREGASALRLAAGVLSRALPRHQGWVWHTAVDKGSDGGGGGGDGGAGDGGGGGSGGGGEGRQSKSLSRSWACLGYAGIALFDLPTDRLPRSVVALEASRLVEDTGMLRAPGVGALLPAFALRFGSVVHTIACASVEDRMAWVSAMRGCGSTRGEEEVDEEEAEDVGTRPISGARPLQLSVGSGAAGQRRPPRPGARGSRRFRDLGEGGASTPATPATTGSPLSVTQGAAAAAVPDDVEGGDEAVSLATGAESDSETEADSVSTHSRSSAPTPRGDVLALISQAEERSLAQGSVWLRVCSAEVVGTVKRPALRFATEVRDDAATAGVAGPRRTVWHSLRQWTALRAKAERANPGLAASQAAGAFTDAKRLFSGLSSAHRAIQCRALDAWAREAGLRARADPALHTALQRFLDEGADASGAAPQPGVQRSGDWVQEDAGALLARAEALESSPPTRPRLHGDSTGVELVGAARGARAEAQRIKALVEQATNVGGRAGERAHRSLVLHRRALYAADTELREGRLRQLGAEARAREAAAAEADVRRELRWWTERDPATAAGRVGSRQPAAGENHAGVDGGKGGGAPDLHTPPRRGRTLSEPTAEMAAQGAPVARQSQPAGKAEAEAIQAPQGGAGAADNDAMVEEARQAAEAARAAMRGSRGSQAEMAAFAREQAAAASKRRSQDGSAGTRRRGSMLASQAQAPHRPRAQSAVWPGADSPSRSVDGSVALGAVADAVEARGGAAQPPQQGAEGAGAGPGAAGHARADRREEHLQRLAQRLMRELASAEESARRHSEALSRKHAEIGSLRRRLRSASVAWEHERRAARAETENASKAADEASGHARAMEREVEVARAEAAALREQVEALTDALHVTGSRFSGAPSAGE